VQFPVDVDLAHRASYSYLLGMYLGDGYISRTPRTYRLEVSLHRNQERVVARVAGAIAMLRPSRPVGLRRRSSVTIVNAYANAWPVLFPQHGVGRKHPSVRSSSSPGSGASWSNIHPSFFEGVSSLTAAGTAASWRDATIRPIRSRITRRTSWSCSSGRAGWSGCVRDARI